MVFLQHLWEWNGRLKLLQFRFQLLRFQLFHPSSRWFLIFRFPCLGCLFIGCGILYYLFLPFIVAFLLLVLNRNFLNLNGVLSWCFLTTTFSFFNSGSSGGSYALQHLRVIALQVYFGFTIVLLGKVPDSLLLMASAICPIWTSMFLYIRSN